MQTLIKSILQIKLGYSLRGDFTMANQKECTSLKERIAQFPSEYQIELGQELRLGKKVTADLIKILENSTETVALEKLGSYASQMPDFKYLTLERKTALGFIQQVCSGQLDVPTGLIMLRDTYWQFDKALGETGQI